MIQIPRKCPAPVRAEVVAAFSLYWNDRAASLNRIRNALELVLDDLKIPKSSVDKIKKKKNRLSLHNRIEKLKRMRPNLKEICERMMAVKHLGNAGSHSGVVVNHADVFDGFDILEWVLRDMYSEHPRMLLSAVRQIDRRKGPRKPKK
jgi:Tfp pilus assembly protein PilO